MKTFLSAKFPFILTAAGSVVVAVALFHAPVAAAADIRKGGEQLLHGLKTQADVEALRPGDTVAMVCAKCQTVMIEQVAKGKGHLQKMAPGAKHLCTGCSSTIEVIGHGKAKTDVVKHVCGTCGEGSAFCCASEVKAK